jgi:hypothetical protein
LNLVDYHLKNWMRMILVFRLILTLNLVSYHLKDMVRMSRFSSQFSPWILLVIISRIWWECLGFQANSHLESRRLSSRELGENVQVFRLVLTLNLINYHLKNQVKMSKFSSQFSSWILSIIISGIGWECPGFQAGSHLESLQWYHWIPYSSWKLIIVITRLVFFG